MHFKEDREVDGYLGEFIGTCLSECESVHETEGELRKLLQHEPE